MAAASTYASPAHEARVPATSASPSCGCQRLGFEIASLENERVRVRVGSLREYGFDRGQLDLFGAGKEVP